MGMQTIEKVSKKLYIEESTSLTTRLLAEYFSTLSVDRALENRINGPHSLTERIYKQKTVTIQQTNSKRDVGKYNNKNAGTSKNAK